MKTKSSLLILLIAAFFLTSCGAKKTAATLEVSTSALTVSNSSYPGGLIIMGSSKSGSFTIPVPTGGSGNKITLDLPRDTWTFSAIGWEGAAAFSGQSKCGSETVDLNQNEQTVALDITYAKCANLTSVFGSNSYRSGDAFLETKFVTCGWLYEDDGITPINSSTPETYCDSTPTFTDVRYKNWPQSIKIEVQKNIDGSVSPGISQCITTGSDGLFSSLIKIPEKGVPFKISLYRQLGCAEKSLVSSFNFSDGPGAAYGDHDSVFNINGSTSRLFLPSFDTKRGYSSLYSEKSTLLVQCNGAPCFSIPTAVPSSKDRIIRSGSEFVALQNPGPNQSCDTILAVASLSITPAPSLADIKSNCEMKNNEMILRLNYTSLSALASVSITFMNDTNFQINVIEDPTYNAHQLAWELVGYPLTPAPVANVRNSFRAFFENKEDSGLLSEVKDMMGPEGAGGILGPGMTCANAVAEKMVTFTEEGETKTYKVQIMDAGATPVISTYIASTGPYAAGNPFDKTILISRQTGPNSFTAEMSMHFKCSAGMGVFYNRHIKNGKIEKRLIEWNTQAASSARVKEIKYEEEKTGTQITRAHSSFRYVESPSDATKIYGRTYQVDIKWNGVDYDYYPSSSRIAVQGTPTGFTYVHAAPLKNTGPWGDSAYLTNILAEEGSPTGQTSSICVNETAFATAPGTCASLPTAVGSNPVYETWAPSNLQPQNIVNFFN